MPATTSDRRRAGYRITPREVPAPWLAAVAVVALGLLLIAGGGPLRPALGTFGVGALAAIALTWLHGALARHRARRRAEAAHAAVLRDGLAHLRADRAERASGATDADERLSAQDDADDLLSALAALTGSEPPGPPRSLAALARSAAAAVRAETRDVTLVVAVEQDTPVCAAGLEPALRGLLRHAAGSSPPGSTLTAAIRRGRIELRDSAPSGNPFAADLARAVARRAGGELHVFDRTDGPGTLTVLELPFAG